MSANKDGTKKARVIVRLLANAALEADTAQSELITAKTKQMHTQINCDRIQAATLVAAFTAGDLDGKTEAEQWFNRQYFETHDEVMVESNKALLNANIRVMRAEVYAKVAERQWEMAQVVAKAIMGCGDDDDFSWVLPPCWETVKNNEDQVEQQKGEQS